MYISKFDQVYKSIIFECTLIKEDIDSTILEDLSLHLCMILKYQKKKPNQFKLLQKCLKQHFQQLNKFFESNKYRVTGGEDSFKELIQDKLTELQDQHKQKIIKLIEFLNNKFNIDPKIQLPKNNNKQQADKQQSQKQSKKSNDTKNQENDTSTGFITDAL